MVNMTFNMVSKPNFPSSMNFMQGNWIFTNGRFQSNQISNSGSTSSHLYFDACVGTVKATIGVSSEENFDVMSLHVREYVEGSPTYVPSRGSGNMANISGVTSGTYTFEITKAGRYCLTMLYAKDSSSSDNDDCGWVTSITLPVAASGTVYTNVSGIWKQGTQYTNVNGVWKEGNTYTNVSGVWKQGQ